MKKYDFYFILKSFLFWRIGIFLISYLVTQFVPLLGENFFGGKLVNYVTNPMFWGLANFDGEHYTSIALYGYKDLQQFFFPVYPTIVRIVSGLFGAELSAYVISGILVSNISLFIALIGLYKLARFDYSEKVSKLSIILILLFPTSFYFGAVYSESLLLCLAVWSFYLFRTNKLLLAAILAGVASATRLVGVILFPVFILNLFRENRLFKKESMSVFIAPLGFIGYAFYLINRWAGPLGVYRSYPLFGEQREGNFILLPQVLYRYFFKIIPSLSWDYFPVVFTTLFEISTSLLFLYLIIISFRKIRWDYWLFSIISYLIPTFSGSFSSMPRYLLLLFPMFFVFSQKIVGFKKPLLIGIFVIMAIILLVAETLFLRGYFVS